MTQDDNTITMTSSLESVSQFALEEKLKKIMDTFNCCGIDYALINESFTWCAPLQLHKYAYRFHSNNQYRYEDPYFSYDLIGLLPRFCHLSEIAVHAQAWQSLFTPKQSKYGDCYAVSYYFWLESNAHRFVLYFDSIHNITSLYLKIAELYAMLYDLVTDIAPLTIRYYDQFVIHSEDLCLLTLPPHWLKAPKDKNIQVALDLSDKEMQCFTLLGHGITEKKALAKNMQVSHRSVDNYTQRLKQLLGLSESYELFEYAKRYWLLA
ncbi:hypothetical protein [Cysteiniphilum halobium]|uniref:hypothetical protein n=1 Tax=Cysteiniphilum halobium TaxID=2219059 RepID=UPI000E6464D4|nr:hypothetical protein [Cysteiniphilum halobium]